MDFIHSYTIAEIAMLTNSAVVGSPDFVLTGINEIHHVRSGDITFCDHPKYMDTALQSAASCVIINQTCDAPEGKVLLINSKPFEAYNNLIKALRSNKPLSFTVHPAAQIHPTAVIEIGAIINERVQIGENSFIGANAIIYNDVVIGAHVRIGAQTVIGSDAFYFKKEDKGFNKWESGGRVIIGDNADIGALCTINKGVSADTRIGEHTKIDCQVHIGHDTVVGARSIIAAQVGISGNVIIGDDVVLYGQVGIAQNLTIGNGVIVLAQSGVSKNLEAGKKYFGCPAQEMTTAYRELAALRNLIKK